jgi:PKD repeat protein
MSFGAGNYSIVLTASNSAGSNTSSQKTFINVTGVISPGSYYRDITVTNSPAIASYQMKVEVPYSAHMKTDFGDIRFTGSDGTTQYDYWIEKKTDGTSAVFWVNVPAASTTIFRMYYGNSSLTTTSDGTKTFDFFDDFSGDLSKWIVEKPVGVYPCIESGYLAAGGGIPSGTYGHTSLGSSPTYNVFQDGIVEFKHQHSADAIGEIAFRGNFALNRGYKGRWDARSGSEQVFLMPPYNGWANIGPAIPKWVTAGPWHEGKMAVHGNVMDLYDDGTFKGTVTDNTYAIAGEIALQNHYGSFTNFDDVRVRKYAATEPTTSIGSEITV